MAQSMPKKTTKKRTSITKHLQQFYNERSKVWEKFMIKSVGTEDNNEQECKETSKLLKKKNDEKCKDEKKSKVVSKEKDSSPQEPETPRSKEPAVKSKPTINNSLEEMPRQTSATVDSPVSNGVSSSSSSFHTPNSSSNDCDMLDLLKETVSIVDLCNRQLREHGMRDMLHTQRIRKMVEDAGQLLEKNKLQSEPKVKVESGTLPKTDKVPNRKVEDSSDDSDDTARYIRSSRRHSTAFRLPMSFRRHCFLSRIKTYRQMTNSLKTDRGEKVEEKTQSIKSTSSNLSNSSLVRVLPQKKFTDNLRSRGLRKKRGRKKSHYTPCLETSEEEHETSTISTGRCPAVPPRSKPQCQREETTPPPVNRCLKPVSAYELQQRVVEQLLEGLEEVYDDYNANDYKKLEIKEEDEVDSSKDKKSEVEQNMNPTSVKILCQKFNNAGGTTTTTHQDDKQHERKRKELTPKTEKNTKNESKGPLNLGKTFKLKPSITTSHKGVKIFKARGKDPEETPEVEKNDTPPKEDNGPSFVNVNFKLTACPTQRWTPSIDEWDDELISYRPLSDRIKCEIMEDVQREYERRNAAPWLGNLNTDKNRSTPVPLIPMSAANLRSTSWTEHTKKAIQEAEYRACKTNDDRYDDSSSDDIIAIYTPELRETLSKERDNCNAGFFDISEEYLSKFIGRKAAEKFFRSYTGRKRFSVNAIVFFKLPSTPPSDASENGLSSACSDVENDLEFIEESGYLYELGHHP